MPSQHNWIKLRPRQDGRHFPDDNFKRIFFNENVWIPIKISLKFVHKCQINNIPALFQIMAWRRLGDKPLSGSMMVRLSTHICVTRPQWVLTYTNLDWIWIMLIHICMWYAVVEFCEHKLKKRSFEAYLFEAWKMLLNFIFNSICITMSWRSLPEQQNCYPVMLVSLCNSFENRAPANRISKWIAEAWLKECVSE